METIDLKEIETVEKKVVKNPDWFYHGYDFGNTAKILEKGILAKKHLDFQKGNFGLNGKHYISVAKDINEGWRALTKYKNNGPVAILDGLKVIECKYSKLYKLFIYTPLPFRYTEWPDEYQVYSQIQPDKIIGIECMVYNWTEQGNIFLLKRFRTMLEVMKELDSQLPIYDFSRQEGDNVHELDKEAFLELSKRLINNTTSISL